MEKLTSFVLYANVSAGWTDISADVIGGISCSWGISGNTPKDRLAETGTMTFKLNDIDGSYTPNGSSVIEGWQQGIGIKVVGVYAGDTYVKFYGILNSIEFDAAPPNLVFANCTITDWMNYAAEHPILTPGLLINKRADEGMQQLLASMPINPASVLLDTGINTFPSIFDLVRQKSVAYSEFAKIVDSELGYIYLRKDATNGEQLVFENANHRSGLLPYAQIPLVTTDALLMETGDYLLLETGDKILLNYTTNAAFTTFAGMEVIHGDNTANRIVVTAYPRRADTAAVVLYTLGSAMQIGNGEIKTFTGNYTDPIGGSDVGGFDMIVPVATTDYTLNTLADGSGTNLTASALVSVTFGANSAQIAVQNTSTSSGYITFFQLRGKGLYTYNQVEYATEDVDSININGYIERSIDQKYQASVTNGAGFANTNLFLDRNPRTVLESIRYCANKSAAAMQSFLNLDVGDLISVTESVMDMTGAYIIQNVEFEYLPGGIIWVTYGLLEHYSYLTGTMTALEIELTDPPQAINYGYLPQVVQTSERSYAAWVYDNGGTYATNGNMIFCGPYADGGGVRIYVRDTHYVRVYSNLFDATPGYWSTPDDSLPIAGWHHVVVTFDCWNAAANPVIYIDGVSQIVTEGGAPAGNLNSEYGAEVVIGNWHTATMNYNAPWHGEIWEVRIYNRILSSAEVTTLYNGGDRTETQNLVPSGLVFQGPCVPTKMDDDYDSGASISEKQPVLENIYRAVGTPHKNVYSTIWTT